MPTFNNVGDSQSKDLLSFGGAVFGVTQKYAGAAFNGGILLGSRPFIACRAAFLAPAMIAVCCLRVLKVQAERLAGLALEARFHVSTSIV